MWKRILLAVALVLILAAGGTWWWLKSLIPSYEGSLKVQGLQARTEVYFDRFGVPHIYANNAHDAYFSLGFVVARDRLFQLEMIRRMAGGRLAEVVGSSQLRSDKFFRTLGLNRHAETAAAAFLAKAPSETQTAAKAYVDGVNASIAAGNKPLEFYLMGYNPEPFQLRDIFLVTGYLAFGFAEGFRIDPLMEGMYRKVGDPFMDQLELGYPDKSLRIPVGAGKPFGMESFASDVTALLMQMPVSPWMGSNSWVVAPSKTKNKKTILCNDTHMGYSQPAVWYEAHLEYPGFRHYGNYVAGFPFALVGHNDFCATGLTMFENDDTDFFVEKVEGDKVMHKGTWVPLKLHTEKIEVKDGESVTLTVKETPHGPLIQDVFESLPSYREQVSVWWNYAQAPSTAAEVVYTLNHAASMEEVRKAAAYLNAPGLNLMYGDKDGHIAWWAISHLVKRRPGLFSKRFLDGASGNDDPLGYYSFSENPQSEDPESGFVYSANNQPDSCASGLYPGYYVPEDRALAISTALSARNDWDVDGMKTLMTSSTSPVYPRIAEHMLEILRSLKPEELSTEPAIRLGGWKGEHGLEAVSPVIFYRWLYWSLHDAMVDKIGPELFKAYINTHFMRTSYQSMLYSFESKWWDNLSTRETENRNVIICNAWTHTIEELSAKLGKDVSGWKWKRVHTLEHRHPAAKGALLSALLNVGPEPVPGGLEVLNNMGFAMDSTGDYKVYYGPAMRRIIDFANTSKTYSVLPTGQSGYFMAPHYSDQFELFNLNTYREQWMDKAEISRQAGKPLILEP